MLGRSRTTTCGVGRMPKTLTDLELIRELEPVAEAGMNQHLAATRNWNPHDYVPWSDGSDYGALGGHDWSFDESRHGIALRDYLVVTRAVDPNALEMARIGQVTAGFSPGQQGQGSVRPETMLDALVYVTFQELATRVSHRNTAAPATSRSPTSYSSGCRPTRTST